MPLPLKGTPYITTDEVEAETSQRLAALNERVAGLRQSGALSQTSLKRYYGQKRFEQVAESNAIEGSTLDVRETELAITKGITIDVHSRQYVEDAKALDRAHERLLEFASGRSPTDNAQVNEIHGLLLAGNIGAGMFRSSPVRISGSSHAPPETRAEVTKQMTDWQDWSCRNAGASAPIRSAILHAWLAHIHPYIDGNGRTARAIGNLELIRSGYPPIIIKKVERNRYYECLSDSDTGNLGPFLELIFDRCESSLIGLERSLAEESKPLIQAIRDRQLKQLGIWNTAVRLVGQMVELELSGAASQVGGMASVYYYESDLDIEGYLELCQGRAVPKSWAFEVRVAIPGIIPFAVLAWVGHRTPPMYHRMDEEGGPSLFWSLQNPDGFTKWISDFEHLVYGQEITSRNSNGDAWTVYVGNWEYAELTTGELAHKICESILALAAR
jgi:Fic family protein